LDEFVYARQGYRTVPEVLARLDDSISQVQVRWKIFGSNGHIEQPSSVVDGFVSRSNKENESLCKAVVRTRDLLHFDIHKSHVRGLTIFAEDAPSLMPSDSDGVVNAATAPLHLNHYAI
jgi:hypothetical protein